MSDEASKICDQDTVQSVRELTASVQGLLNTIILDRQNSSPVKSRKDAKERDEVVKAINEQCENGPPERVPDWKEIELMPVEEIETKRKGNAQKYEDFWKDLDESTQSEKNAALQAYTSAFSRFQEIYELIGWGRSKDVMFDNSILTENRDLLIESIFGIEAYRMAYFRISPEKSRSLFEISRLPRLLTILVRIACRQIYFVGACGEGEPVQERPFSAGTVINVLAHVARSLRSIDISGGVNKMTMEELLHQCYARRMLNQPAADDVDTYDKHFELLYDCLTALDFTRKFREIREGLCLLFYFRYKSEPIHTIFEHVKAHSEATVGIDIFPELPLEENIEPTFQPEVFSIKYLQDFGGLNIEWTDCLDEHLKIYAGRNAIRIFAHPTFFYNNLDLHGEERDYVEPTFYELSLTYALLFRPTSRSNLKHLKRYITAGKDQEIAWHKCVTFNSRPIHRHMSPWAKEKTDGIPKILDINPVQHPTKNILSESFYRCTLPPNIQVAFNIAKPSSAVRGIAGAWNQHRETTTSMRQISELVPNCPEDLVFMITSLMENNLEDTEAYIRFAYFAPRLRRLKMYLDSRQPSTIRELWSDRRDYRSWCTFWGAWIFGSCILLLMLIILGVQLAQVATLYSL
ncbi:hypothetical protein BGW36DRAFT_460699 [Talaromyces proteolyticus]|uniref:Uncharacterized protein n=1 Tax=Talaromyces proteolyticus TaxID=1131652 RepID=A0AAD4KRL5_9EURO|nr:uncharacterized protein BGW36DRAFT_460699 [Talaromyces proteolyticus]KAH8698869.1 hypothetical protein BGW36DRAFT_460699 [Talaromyces proteolyticus]